MKKSLLVESRKARKLVGVLFLRLPANNTTRKSVGFLFLRLSILLARRREGRLKTQANVKNFLDRNSPSTEITFPF